MVRLEKDKYLTLLSKAVECSINAIGMTDLEGRLIYVNDAAVKLWRYNNKQEMLGRYLPEFWEGERIVHTIEELHCKGFSAGQDLENKSRELEEVNAALRVLLKKREEDKIELEERILSNVKKIIEPYLEKLQGSSLSERQKTYLLTQS
jgi:PAS domain-containing protein